MVTSRPLADSLALPNRLPVERQMPYIRDSLWRGRAWVAETDMQTGAIAWCRNVAGARTHRSLEGAAPVRVFEAVELRRPLHRCRGRRSWWRRGRHPRSARTVTSRSERRCVRSRGDDWLQVRSYSVCLSEG